MKDEYPLILDRVKSSFVDLIIISASILLITEILNTFENVPNWVRPTLFVLVLLYEPIMICFGATLGNSKMGIGVRQNSNPSKKINIFQSIIRYFLKVMLGWISFLLIIFNSKGRAIHDVVSGSVMIKTEKQ